LGVRKCSDAAGFYGFPAGILSSTAEGGTGTANSVGVTYTDVAVTAKPYVLFGYADYNSGLVTAGSWAVSPSPPVTFGPGVPKPGDLIGSAQATTATQTPNTTTSYVDTALTATITTTS
jgi:hypothetical protein